MAPATDESEGFVPKRVSAHWANLASVRLIRGAFTPERRWQTYLIFGLLAVVGLFAVDGNGLRTWTPPLAAIIGATATAVGTRRIRPVHARAWYGLSLGILMLGLGDLSSAGLAIQGPSRSTASIADAMYLAGYAALVVSLVSLAWPRGLASNWEPLFDTVIGSLGVGLLAWVFVIQPATVRTAGLDAADTLITIAYPVLGGAMGILLVGMLLAPERSRAVQLLYVGLACFLFGDLWYLHATLNHMYVSGSWQDIAWSVSYIVWGAAGMHPSARGVGRLSGRENQPLSQLRIIGLSFSCVLAPVLLLWEWGKGLVTDLPLIALTSLILIVLWAARLAVTVTDLRRALNVRAELEGRLREQAERDVLTGLLNRASFMARVRSAFEAGDCLAVLFIDLDDFKVINDTSGHPGGDAVLIEVAHRVTALLRPPHVAARLGGDEFGILLPVGDVAAAQAVAARTLQNLARPVSIEGRAVHVEASIGISVGGPGKSAEDMIREADVAMYLAKGSGKHRFVVFEEAMHAGVIRRMSLRAELEQAIGLHQFTVLYQPIVTLPGAIVSDCEALVRWQHPVRGLLEPEEFIDIAEETGLIVSLGRWLLDEACFEAADWQTRIGDDAPGVAVNVSALQVRNPMFATDVRNALARSGLDPHRLIIELTETILIEVGSAVSLVSELSEIGVRIAIDDFGTGYSSLAYLASYPVDILKIDRSFVSALETGPRETRLVSAIIALGKDLGLSVIAEGVETEAQLSALVEQGCGAFQGYYFARPMRGHDLIPLLIGAASRHEPFKKNLLVPVERSA
jgi:diguanylate cyclase (GGDEF)-like protein